MIVSTMTLALQVPEALPNYVLRYRNILIFFVCSFSLISINHSIVKTNGRNQSNEQNTSHAFIRTSLIVPDPEGYIQTNFTVLRPSLNTLPNQVLEQYKAWHSSDVLRGESANQLNERKFSMVYFSCPLQAGNRIHHFLNSMIWAIVTNRTILFKYYDAETCTYHQQLQSQFWHDPGTCNAGNLEHECNEILQRADWIPLYSEWEDVISDSAATNLSNLVKLVDYWYTRSYTRAPQWERNRFPQLNTTNQRTELIDEMEEKLVDFPMLVGKEDVLMRRFQRNAILKSEEARERATSLYSEGAEYLFGMLSKETLTLLGEVEAPQALKIGSIDDTTSTLSIAIHSRHRSGADGKSVRKETKCIDRMLSSLSPNATCHICIMSDRPITIALISQLVETKYNCTVYSNNYSNSTESSGSWLSEHGPNAGARFFRDLDLCQHFMDGFIGTGKGASSTQLLEEWIAYNRKVVLTGKDNHTSQDTDKCWI